MSWMDRCPKHGAVLQDFNAYGEPFRQPVCLDCRWESGKGSLLVRIIRRVTTPKGRFLLHWGPVTVFIRRSLTNRLNRLMGKRGFTLEEIAPMAGDSPEQVLDRLRKFEERRGSVRTKQTPSERKEQGRIDNHAMGLLSKRSKRVVKDEAYAWLAKRGVVIPSVELDEMISLDDPGIAQAAGFARYHELGGAKKRKTSEVGI